MANYKALLRQAIRSLPESNAASRQAVYEQTRMSVVSQLRAINPPLPVRKVTAHRLQLEECIREIEQEF